MVKDTIIFALTSSKELAKEISMRTGAKLGNIKVDHFADGEILVTPNETVRGRDVFIVQSTYYPVTERLMEVLVCIDALKRASAGEITVFMPYFGYARQDRKAAAHQPITAKLVANLLQTAGANRIVTVDLHAAQIQGFFDIPIDDMTAVPLLADYYAAKQYPAGDLVVVSPDHGGVVRARRMAELLNAPLAIIDKRRPRPNEVMAENLIGNVDGKACVIVDDIADTAGSLCAAAEMVRSYGAKEVFAAITHGVFSRDALEKIEASALKEIVISDTIPMTEEKAARTTKVRQVSMADVLSEVLIAIVTHASVANVYDKYNKRTGE
ncbi:MAG: ribose-phosphate pyrophosphokinase [Solobacterium sp.]|nr:ribose-phosphate pyrophosphokinase [Solobacterium sp.]